MKFKAMKQHPVDYTLRVYAYSAGVESIDRPLVMAPDNLKHAALRAIAEHLGPEESALMLLESLPDEARARVTGSEKLRAQYFCDWQGLYDAIRAAGYDPEKVGAAEVIGTLHRRVIGANGSLSIIEKDRGECRSHIEELESEIYTARAQLREWRETVTHLLRSYTVPNAVRERLQGLLSATPDEGAEQDRQEDKGRLLYKLKCIRDELVTRGCSDPVESGYSGLTRFALCIRSLADERDAALKQVGELEADRDNWVDVCRELWPDPDWTVEPLTMREQVWGERKRVGELEWEAERARADAKQTREFNGRIAQNEFAERDRAEAAEKRVGELEKKYDLLDSVAAATGVERDRLRDQLEESARNWRTAADQAVALRQRTSRAETTVEALRPLWEAVDEWAHRAGGPDDMLIDGYGQNAERVRQALADYDSGAAGASPWSPTCDNCGKVMTEPGGIELSLSGVRALRIGPPEGAVVRVHGVLDASNRNGGELTKRHVCRECWEGAKTKGGDANDQRRRDSDCSPNVAPPPARVVGGGKLEPLELRCADAKMDKLEMRRDCGAVSIVARERDRVAAVYLDRESVRLAVNWMTAWLGDRGVGDEAEPYDYAELVREAGRQLLAAGRAPEPAPPDTADTPEAIARAKDCLSPERCAARIRALVVGELRTVRDRMGQTLPPWHHRTEFAHGKADAIEHINARIRALESELATKRK